MQDIVDIFIIYTGVATMLMAWFAGSALYSWRVERKHVVAYETHKLLTEVTWKLNASIIEWRTYCKNIDSYELPYFHEELTKLQHAFLFEMPVSAILCRAEAVLGKSAIVPEISGLRDTTTKLIEAAALLAEFKLDSNKVQLRRDAENFLVEARNDLAQTDGEGIMKLSRILRKLDTLLKDFS